MSDLQALIGQRLTRFFWTGPDAVLTFEEGQLRLVVKVIRSTPPKTHEIGFEVRDGVDFQEIQRYGEIIQVEEE